MFWVDGYADMYQEINGFESTVYTLDGEKTAWISMKPTTRAAYDLSMRENTIDGIITMDGLDKLKSGYIYILKDDPLLTLLDVIVLLQYKEKVLRMTTQQKKLG